MARKKSNKICRIEEKFGKPLESLLSEGLTHEEVSTLERKFEVGKNTVYYWAMRYGVEYRRIALAPGERVIIERVDGRKEVWEVKPDVGGFDG